MKVCISLWILLSISLSSFAQQGINYKAIIKDTNGNVLATEFMNVQFTIHESSVAGTIVYQEDYNYTTDSNGMIILNIGSDPTPSVGVFEDINWSTDIHFLQMTITYSEGTIDFDPTEFMAVPYAKHAKTAENVSGLEQITEGGNTGWRLLNRDPLNYADIGDESVDLSRSFENGESLGASGFASFASGDRTEASGSYSIAMGNNTIANGFASTALGQYNVGNTDTVFAIGDGSPGTDTPIRKNALSLNKSSSSYDFIIGNSQIDDDPSTQNDNTKFFFNGVKGALRAGRTDSATGNEWDNDNTGFYSTAFGIGTTASGSNSFASGEGTIASTFSSIAVGRFNLDDANAQFMVGNGSSNTSRSTAFKVGKDGSIIAPEFEISDITNDKALITKEYLDANGATGLQRRTDNEGRTGWNLIGLGQSPWLGQNGIDLSQSNLVSPRTGALGTLSLAAGFRTRARGDYSSAFGNNTEAFEDSSFAIGMFNLFVPSALFIVGNGTSTSQSNNALTILTNGDAQFDAEIQTTSTGNANMIPIAYGTVESNGNIRTGTGNFIASVTANVFTIDVNDTESLSYDNTVCLITPISTAPRTSSTIIANGNPGNNGDTDDDLIVRIFNASGSLAATTFQFVIYKL